MPVEPFAMERFQSLWENVVEYNLSESGIHPLKLSDLTDEKGLENLLKIPIGYSQTNGTEELRATIALLYPDATTNNVLVTTGSAEANFLSAWALLEPGDEVALMLPNYMQVPGLAKAFGAIVKPFHLVPRDGKWQIDWDELEKAVTPQTRLIAICNPNNPTGSRLNLSDIQNICDLAKKYSAWLLSDEIYRGAERDGELTPTFWGLYDKAFVVTGLSKAYGLPGLRIGWILAPEDLIEKFWSHHDYTTICPNPLSDYLARIALGSPNREKILERTRRLIGNNFRILEAWVQRHANILEWIPPTAGAITLVKYNLKIKSLDLVTRLRQEKSVLIVPGEHFLMENYLRIGFGSESEYLKNGLGRISEFLPSVH